MNKGKLTRRPAAASTVEENNQNIVRFFYSEARVMAPPGPRAARLTCYLWGGEESNGTITLR